MFRNTIQAAIVPCFPALSQMFHLFVLGEIMTLRVPNPVQAVCVKSREFWTIPRSIAGRLHEAVGRIKERLGVQ
ncbi:hypothetical protein P175DRAFT_0531064 [Aspergillus ochraceoroseus IBT 24754]|uniref:Uncharacterized protein n=1 Tax=Aspergillus ochraceoroseus IBT 24754 TaxID=1392256 RepID=A0A2T5LZ36_9EURO|nr:uncharacterized protein P175DRAFT_0531064 [Aspergillus ochraceoroseus IBT 24754]PTU21551.1 hypothetical protein P175DRAFT_0531064 [Aspergillus ochraceoroseus IBT 24754]